MAGGELPVVQVVPSPEAVGTGVKHHVCHVLWVEHEVGIASRNAQVVAVIVALLPTPVHTRLSVVQEESAAGEQGAELHARDLGFIFVSDSWLWKGHGRSLGDCLECALFSLRDWFAGMWAWLWLWPHLRLCLVSRYGRWVTFLYHNWVVYKVIPVCWPDPRTLVHESRSWYLPDVLRARRIGLVYSLDHPAVWLGKPRYIVATFAISL